MAKSKLSLENSSLNWSDKRRYKVNAIVSYSGSTYQNLTGKNSEPGVGPDWFKVPDTTGIGGPITTDAVTNNSNVAGVTATDALNTLDTKIPKDYAKIVYVNNNNPNSATVFDLNNPPVTNDNALKEDVSNLYIGLDESSWVYNSVSLVYEVEVYNGKASNFYLEGTNKDAGNNKNSAIERSGTIGIGTATKPNHAVTKEQLDTKLDASLYNDRFKGVYTSLAALNSAHPTAEAGDYAQVNEVGATDVVNYSWDAEENIWVEGGSGGSGATNTDALPEGSINLYFTTARVLSTLLSGLSLATGGAIVSTDSVLVAFGKIQKQINDLTSAIGLKVDANASIMGATKTKVTYDSKGLVTGGSDATTADIADSTNKRYVSDAQLVVLGNTSGTNSGNETASSIASIHHGATAKTTLVDADEITGQDSASGFGLIRVTCLNLYNYLKAKFDSVYQATDTQIEISASGNVQNSWHGQTILFTDNCTITVPSTLNNSLMFAFRTLAGVTVTWAITSPFTWETTPSTTPEKTVGHFMRRGSTNTIILDM